MRVNPNSYIFGDVLSGGGSRGSKRFDEGTIGHLRNRLSEYLVAVGITLNKKGARLIGSCPVHDDRDPSFSVFGREHATCGCHPCGFTGDVFATSMWLGRASSFPDAVRDVAAVLGVVHADQPIRSSASHPTRERAPSKPPELPFHLSDEDLKKIQLARLAFSDAFWGEEEIIDRIARHLGFKRETLRLAAWGCCGLALVDGWLAYAYPTGLKRRNPHPSAKPRFHWTLGKATEPWRMGWVKPETLTVYVTEGESDTMALIEAGLELDGESVCVASPGTSFSRSWAPLFHGKRVVLCFDDDPPGRQATKAVAKILNGHASQILTWRKANCDE